MNPVPLFLIIVTLPLLLGGCGEKHEGVNAEAVEEREGIYYLVGSDTPYTGKSFALWKNGKKRDEGNYKDGKKHGLWIAWHENGKKHVEVKIKDGKYDGLWTAWHENGKKAAKINYKDGKPEGLAFGWHENGQKHVEVKAKDGKYDGLWTAWHENGKKGMEANYKEGRKVEGSEKFWNNKGEPVDSMQEAGLRRPTPAP